MTLLLKFLIDLIMYISCVVRFHPKYPVELADEVLVRAYGEVFGTGVGVGFEDIDAEVLERALHGVDGVAHAVGVTCADAEEDGLYTAAETGVMTFWGEGMLAKKAVDKGFHLRGDVIVIRRRDENNPFMVLYGFYDLMKVVVFHTALRIQAKGTA